MKEVRFISKEPAVIIGAVFTLLVWAYGFFFEGNAENQLRLHEFLQGLIPLIVGVITRSQVTPARAPRP